MKRAMSPAIICKDNETIENFNQRMEMFKNSMKKETERYNTTEAMLFGKPFKISEENLINILTKESSFGNINTISIQKSNNEYWVVFDNKKIGE